MPKIGETLWYVAHVDGTWLALAVFSAPALKCRARDSWVGWDFRYQYGRLHLVSNNSRLLILPGHHYRNLGSRFLGLCARRIVGDWPARFGLPHELRRSLACTNIVENALGTVRQVTRNVKRWRHAEMALRWTAAGLLEAQKTFRRLKAYRQLPILRNALQEHLRKAQADSAIETIMKAA